MIDSKYCDRLARKSYYQEHEDLGQELKLLCWKLKDKPEKYIKTALYNFIKNFYRKKKRERIFVPLDEALKVKGKSGHEATLALSLAFRSEKKNKRALFMIISGYTTREISKKLKFSLGKTHQIILGFRSRLKENI